MDESGTLLGAIHIITDISDQARTTKELEDRIQGLGEQCLTLKAGLDRLHRLGRHLIEGSEAESLRISQSLSGSIVEPLTCLKIALQTLLINARDQSLHAVLEESLETIDRSDREAQKLLEELRPPLLDDLGLVPALRRHTDLLTRRYRIPIHLMAEGSPPRFSPELETACFHLVRLALALTLARVGGRTRDVTVSFRAEDGRIYLLVADSGPGQDIPREGPGTESGPAWWELEERIRLVHGKSLIRTLPDGKWEVHLTIPGTAPRPVKNLLLY